MELGPTCLPPACLNLLWVLDGLLALAHIDLGARKEAGSPSGLEFDDKA